MSEEDLLIKIASNDKKAFEQVFRAHYVDLCRFGKRYVRDELVAEEIVQEIFVNIWDRRDKIKITTSVKAYLYTAVRNRSFNYIKLQLPKEQNKVELDSVIDHEFDLDETGSIEEIHREVQKAISALPKKCRIIFDLSRNGGLTYNEIAEELDLSPKTVENQVGVALRKLREQLHPIWEKIMLILVIFFQN